MSKKREKGSKIPTFIAGALVGAFAGLVLAQKTGTEFISDVEDNFEDLKQKAKKMYDNKEEIIDNINRNIKKVTKMEIKYFDEPEYYSKEFSE